MLATLSCGVAFGTISWQPSFEGICIALTGVLVFRVAVGLIDCEGEPIEAWRVGIVLILRSAGGGTLHRPYRMVPR